jgi:glucose/arabinose dehydrogenase
MLANQKADIPKGSSYIRFEKKGYLYVEYGDNHVVKIKNTIGEIKQNYVYVKEIDGELVVSLKPFKEEKEKRTYNRKKK